MNDDDVTKISMSANKITVTITIPDESDIYEHAKAIRIALRALTFHEDTISRILVDDEGEFVGDRDD